MADIFDMKKRSLIMRGIKGKNTKPELVVRKHLFSKGFRYRLHQKDLPGKPDIVLARYSTVIFVHGCFWHAHKGCKNFRLPKTNRAWWKRKLDGNRERDLRNQKALQKNGWNVLVVHECDLGVEKLNLLGTLIKGQKSFICV